MKNIARGSLSLKGILVISRPFWWPNTAVLFIIGALLPSRELSPVLLIGAAYFTMPYNLLMYGVNDIYDYESDVHNPRKNGGVDGSVLSPIKHPAIWRLIAILNAPFLLYFVITGNVESTIFLIMMIFMVFAYSVKGLRYKEIPVIDSLTSAFHYSSPFIFGLLLFESPNLWAPAFAAFFFWVVGNHAFGAIQDISPDRHAGIGSIATYLGTGKTLLFSLAAYSLSILAAVLGYGTPGLIGLAAVLPYIFIIISTLPQRSNSEAPQFKQAWKNFLVLNYIIGGIGSVLLIYLYNN